jgi:hypothetical protein
MLLLALLSIAVAPEALAALEKMGGFLRTLPAFTIRAETTIDEDSTPGKSSNLAVSSIFVSALRTACVSMFPQTASSGSSFTMAKPSRSTVSG